MEDIGPPPVDLDTAMLVYRLVPGDWVELAACGHRDPELFYPVGSSGPALQQVAEAKAVCSRCPVEDECLEWALDVGEAHGVWGGTTPEERRFLRRDLRVVPRNATRPAARTSAPRLPLNGCRNVRGAT